MAKGSSKQSIHTHVPSHIGFGILALVVLAFGAILITQYNTSNQTHTDTSMAATGSNLKELKSVSTGKCLTVKDNRAFRGQVLVMTACDATKKAEQFTISPDAHGNLQIYFNENPHYCVSNLGTLAVTEPCARASTYATTIMTEIAITKGVVAFHNAKKLLTSQDAKPADPKPEAKFTIKEKTIKDSQKWHLVCISTPASNCATPFAN